MEGRNGYVDIEELDFIYGIEEICSVLDFKEERIVMFLTDNYNIEDIAFELNLTINEIEEHKENAIEKIVDKFGRG